MASRDRRTPRGIDHVDRRSQLGVSRALRARDVSRPDPADIDAALDRLDAGEPGRKVTPSSARESGEARRTPRSG